MSLKIGFVLLAFAAASYAQRPATPPNKDSKPVVVKPTGDQPPKPIVYRDDHSHRHSGK